jgi:CHASE3 domain sensor protein
MIRRIFERVIWVGVVAIVAILIAGAITYSRVQLLSDAAAWVNRTERVRFSLQRILSTLQDAESAARGYLISREDAFLEPYTGARVQLDAELRSLTSLLTERPDQLARAGELARRAHARLDHLDEAVKTIRAGTSVMPKPPLATGEAKRLMDSVRTLVATMQVEEASQLAGRVVATSHARSAAGFAGKRRAFAARPRRRRAGRSRSRSANG